MSKYEKLVSAIIENIGGKKNVINVTHCMTRLRFALKDFNIVKETALKDLDQVTTAQKSGGNYQVVVGTIVEDVYEETIKQLGLSQEQKELVEKKSLLNRFIDVITKTITPVLGILCATGIIQGLTSLLLATGIITNTSGTYIVLNAIGQALFYFFPVILGYTAAKAFKTDGFVGMLIGACLIYPGILESLTSGEPIRVLFANTLFSTSIYKDFFGLPIIFPANGYSSTVIPIILSMFFVSKFEHLLKRKIPDIVGFTIVPLLTILVGVPATILLIGPVANILNLLILAGLTSLMNFSTVLATIVVGIFYQPLVIFGLHWPLITLAINNFVTQGHDYILPMIFTASFAQTAVVLGVYVKTKNRKTKSICVPAIISGLFCIIEPAIYGVTLPIKKRFAFSAIAATIGAIILSITHTEMYAVSVGILGFVGFINPASASMTGVIIAVIAVLVTMIIAFILTIITFNENPNDIDPDQDQAKTLKEKSLNHTYEVYAPISGKIISLSETSDKAFSNEAIGKGVTIIPDSNKVIAPFDGTVKSLFSTGHAIGIESEDGIEMLIHIGIDTVEIKEPVFTKRVAQGDNFKKGDVLIEFDRKRIMELGYSIETPVIITNVDEFLDVLEEKNDHCTLETSIMKVVA